MGEQTADVHVSAGESLPVIAHVYQAYPRHVQDIAALAAEHAEQAAAGGQPDSFDARFAAFEQALRAFLRDPLLAELQARLSAVYEPPPYSQPLKRRGEIEAHGEPVTATGAAILIGLGALYGGLIGASLPL